MVEKNIYIEVLMKNHEFCPISLNSFPEVKKFI